MNSNESGTRFRATSTKGLEDPRNRAVLSLECWRYTATEYWGQCAWDDAQKAGVDWDELCLEVLGEKVDPPKVKS